jgi:3-hydroxybutyryl-CoA dehydrogenase
MIGVAGAGTMGSLIAALGCVAGEEVLLWDVDAAGLEKGVERGREELRGGAERGRWDAGLDERLRAAGSEEDLAGCDIVIEAIVERVEPKRDLFARIGERNPDAVLATNTSSLLVTAIANGVPNPERVVGFHFFNPATRMKLVEVVAGAASSDDALARISALGEAMGKTVVTAVDGPGFLVNRSNRPFGLEAVGLLQERVADVQTIDRIVRLGGGFRMGPFELQDFGGIDIGFAVAQSFYEQSFGEPRWRPSPLSAKMVAAGWLGRKSSRGWYEYPAGRPEDPEAPAAGGSGTVGIGGGFRVIEALRERATEAGWTVEDAGFAGVAIGGRRVPLLAGGSLETLGGTTGFHAVAPLALVELTGKRDDAVEGFFRSLGLHTEWVGDGPGLVLGRIICQLVNEACFAVGEGVGSPEDVDTGMVLGLNHPRGPFAWLEELGREHVIDVLDALRAEHGDRYRVAPYLSRLGRARSG